MEKEWNRVAGRVLMGGPAIGTRGEEFTPGMYLKDGYTITSRGCPNRCWFCDVWKRDGDVKELLIRDGWNILDDNILATSCEHFSAVCEMLSRQKHRAEFTGGLEAKRLSVWHVNRLTRVNPAQMFFAYDTPSDYEPLVMAGRRMKNAGFKRNQMRCYVLVGYPADTFSLAKRRLQEAWDAGYLPMAMLWRHDAPPSLEWRRFQKTYARPASTKAVLAGRAGKEA
ncbi:MAG: hypothetical protein ACYTEQ_25380 [Planctomycetota bacterium]|jgi:hypothetical protein